MTASEKRARAPSMDPMDQDSPQSSPASSQSNNNNNNNINIDNIHDKHHHPPPPPLENGHPTGTTPVATAVATAGTPTTAGAGAVHTGDSSSTASTTPNPPQPQGPRPSSAASKRRRGLGVVTPNACTECRKKRAKCDGQRPCGRCKAQKDVGCVYEVPVRQSKETLRSELEHLRRQQRSNDSVLSALARNEQWEEVLRRLRSGQSIESISEWLNGQLAPAANNVPAFARPPPVRGNLTPLATFAGASSHSYTPNLGGPASATLSPTSTAHPLSARQDMDPASPWSTHFSTTTNNTGSQALSARSSSHRGSMSWTSGPPQGRVGSWVEDDVSHMHSSDAPRYRGVDQILAPEMPPTTGLATTWTEVSHDEALVQHLLALYFCWEYPTFASLSKEHFLKDFQAGRPRYCSPILVNALLALGCRFSSQPSTLANPSDPYSSGDHFFKECQRLFYQEENHHSLTTIQALGIMSIREASCGRDSESWYYAGQSIRLAVEMGLHRVDDNSGGSDEVAVQAATFWGAFALDHAWSLATGSLPQCSCFPHLPPKPAIMPDIEASFWIPYTDDGKRLSLQPLPGGESHQYAYRANEGTGAPLQRSCEQPSNVRSVYKCFCELSELVHQSLYVLHSPGRPLTSRDLLNIYTQYLNWYDKIPEVLRLGHNFTPAVLFAHMYYHFAILLLFRPLIKLRIIGSSISPRDVCTQAADAIQGLLRSYSQLYTLRRTPSFVPYFVLTSSIMHLAIASSRAAPPSAKQAKRDGTGTQAPNELPDVVDTTVVTADPRVVNSINQGIADLTEMAPCHHFAEQALNILRYLAKKWNIEVDVDISKSVAEVMVDEYRSEGNERELRMMKDPDYATRPVTESLNFFAPNFSQQDLVSKWGSEIPTPESPSTPPSVTKSGEAMENPLFWPFPMQGRPMLPSGDLLKDAGFELL